MLFFKQKQKKDELLPPPPPLNGEFKEEKPKFFDEIIKPKKSEPIPEEKEFSDLVKEFEELKPKKTLRKSVKAITKKIPKAKKQVMPVKAKPIQLKKVNVQQLKEGIEKQKIPAKAKLEQIKKVEIKKLKKAESKKLVKIKPVKKEKLKFKKIKARKQEKPQVELPELGEDFGLKDIDFGLPKEEIKLPETLEDFDIDELGEELEQKAKPDEILEAQKEIQSAIDKIKKRERPSFFSKLFERKEKEKQEESYPAFPIQNGNGLSAIQNSIKKARDALMRFDLEAAKRNYIEIMRLYNNLSSQDKARVYNDINELYYERKNAEELKV